MTATRSQWASISPSRWLTSITTLPRAARSCIAAKSWSDSSSVSAELGSSNRKKRASTGERPRDLDALADGERALRERAVARSGSMAELAQDRQVVGRVTRERDRRRLAADRHVLGDREVRPELRLLVHDRHAVARVARRPRRAVRPGSRPRPAPPRPPGSRTSVRLPAPFGPGDAQDLARADRQVDALERPRLPERLADPAQLHRDRAPARPDRSAEGARAHELGRACSSRRHLARAGRRAG